MTPNRPQQEFIGHDRRSGEALVQHLRELEDRIYELESALEDRLEELDDTRQALREREGELADALCDLADLSAQVAPGTKESDYLRLVARVRRAVHELVPDGARVAVASKGDEELLRFGTCSGEHLPRDRNGAYPGFHPGSGKAVIAGLEDARWRGVDYFVLPRTLEWWLESYPELTRYLERRCLELANVADTCTVWSLRHDSPWRPLDDLLGETRLGLDHEPVILDWQNCRDLRAAFPECQVFVPGLADAPLPYLDESIDVVVVPDDDEMVAEAIRVASTAVVVLAETADSLQLTVDRRDRRAYATAEVSIVVTARDPISPQYTSRLIDTLPPSIPVELVVVDNSPVGSVPSVADCAEAPNLRLTMTAHEGGLSDRKAHGVRVARNDIVVFLDGETHPVAGWLPSLLRAFRDFPEAAVVSGMLLAPDGRLLHAGARIGRRGAPRVIGLGDYQVERPSYNHARRVDLGASTLFATHSEALHELVPPDRGWRDGWEHHYFAALRGSDCEIIYTPDVIGVTSWSAQRHLQAVALPEGYDDE